MSYEVHWVGNNKNNTHGIFSTLEEAQKSVQNWWEKRNFKPPYIRQWQQGNKVIWDYGSHRYFYEFWEVAGTYRLWYVEDGIMYFTDHFETQWADDANDAPYEHNAGTPYTWQDDISEEENIKRGNGHIRYLAFMKDWDIKEPCDGHLNSLYSVEDINKGAVAWLYHKEVGGLMAGSTMEEAKEWCKKAGIKCGELR